MFNITNSFEHPTRPGHTIFRFYQKQRAEMFKKLLIESNVWFETDIDDQSENITYFFGVKNADLKIANNKNYLVSAKFRNKIIPNVYFRWGVIVFAVVIIVLAIISAIKT